MSSLDRQITARILKQMKNHYGATLFDGVNPEALLDEWSRVLSGLTEKELEHGFRSLPPGRIRSPGVFRKLCRPERTAAQHEYRPEPRKPSKLTKEDKLEYFEVMRNALSAMGDSTRVCRSKYWIDRGQWTAEHERRFQARLEEAGMLRKYG